MKEEIVTNYTCVLQESSCESPPSQSNNPLLTQNRDLVIDPPPHDTVHRLHGDHSVQYEQN